MKKLLSLLLVSLLISVAFVGCKEEEVSSVVNASSQNVTTSTNSESETVTSASLATSSNKPSSSSKPKKPASKVETTTETSSEEEKVYSAKEKIYYGMDPDLYQLSLKNKGNSARIAALMKKAQKGGSYKIAVLGGSISQGAGTSNPDLCYGNLVCEWWSDNFPKASFEFVNAGIGATNPEMANYRIEADLLSFKPDFVVVDFTVNTYLDNNLYNTYSTLLYKILSQKNSPAVMSIDFTSCNREKHDYASIYEKTTDVPNSKITKAVEAYDVPAVSYHNYVWEKINKRKISWRDIGFDYIHPNDNGHRLAASIIACYLKNIMENLSKQPTKITSPAKPESNDYFNLGYITNTAKGVKLSGGFSARNNMAASTRGWSYTLTSANSSLTIPIPANKAVKIFMVFDDGAEGQINITDSANKSKTISSSNAKTPTLVDVGMIEGNITLTPSMKKGGFTIYGIGIKKF